MPLNNGEAIAAVNHWRGQFLDSFARVERAVIEALEALAASAQLKEPMHEVAAHRTRQLTAEIEMRWPDDQKARRAAACLKNWTLRERQRNHLVHGLFVVKSGTREKWSLVNEVVEIKKGISMPLSTPITSMEADAFLQAVTEERKSLIEALGAIGKFAA